MENKPNLTSVIGSFPFRMAFAGGWIDQPFVSRHHPAPPGSMVVVAIEPTVPFMERCGMGTSTRRIAAQLWGDQMPDRDPMSLVRELYEAENQGRPDPSGSQDMIGMIYPGVNRLDYDYDYAQGLYPVAIASTTDSAIAKWLESIIYMVPVAQRPAGYDPLGIKNLDPAWIAQLGNSGKACYDSILSRDIVRLGESMNACMRCWEAILPHTVRHPTITIDLLAILGHYQAHYAGAMYSGCGGGYIYVVSEVPVPGGFQVQVRVGS